jgi:hypothetical protein
LFVVRLWKAISSPCLSQPNCCLLATTHVSVVVRSSGGIGELIPASVGYPSAVVLIVLQYYITEKSQRQHSWQTPLFANDGSPFCWSDVYRLWKQSLHMWSFLRSIPAATWDPNPYVPKCSICIKALLSTRSLPWPMKAKLVLMNLPLWPLYRIFSLSTFSISFSM